MRYAWYFIWRINHALFVVHSASVSNSSQPHRLKHASFPCPSPSPRVCPSSCPLNQWCHPAISSSVTLFSYLQSSLASGSFPVSWLLASGGQSIGASTSVLPMNIRGWFPLGLTGLVSLQSKGLSRVFFSTTVWKCQFFDTQPSLWSNSHPYMTTGKIIALTRRTFVGKVMCLLFNIWENETNVSCQKARQPEGGAGRERWSWRDGRGC